MRLKPLLISCSVALGSAVLMAEQGLAPAQATIKATAQIRGAVIGITLVLVAVFLPMAFFPGSTGGIYRQFSVTLATSIAFSAALR
jgi:multidrug efflux pump